MRTKIALSLVFLLLSLTSFAQGAKVINTETSHDTIYKDILDNAKYRVYYTYRYLPEAISADNQVETLTLLQIGDQYNRFMDYNRFRSDSVNDVSVKNNLALAEYMPSLMNLGKVIKFKSNIVINKSKNEIITQQNIILTERYQFKEESPLIKWTITNSDTILLGYNCRKATAVYKGRSYIAWYSEEIAMPYGPYKFNGLPGLIFYIHDTENNHSFILCGLEKSRGMDPVYLWTGKNIIKTKRENAMQIHKNYCGNPGKALINSGKKITIAPEVLATLQPLPYNPIELE
ncbi:MAG: GLPGLI family protein [Bacteroidales bacterium]